MASDMTDPLPAEKSAVWIMSTWLSCTETCSNRVCSNYSWGATQLICLSTAQNRCWKVFCLWNVPTSTELGGQHVKSSADVYRRGMFFFLPRVGRNGSLRHGGPNGAVNGPAAAPEVGAAKCCCCCGGCSCCGWGVWKTWNCRRGAGGRRTLANVGEMEEKWNRKENLTEAHLNQDGLADWRN